VERSTSVLAWFHEKLEDNEASYQSATKEAEIVALMVGSVWFEVQIPEIERRESDVESRRGRSQEPPRRC
jgi:hypothetical protein